MTDEEQKAALHRFWVENLAPAAERLRGRGVELFPRGPEPGAATFFVERTDRTDYIDAIDTGEFEARLRERWQGEGLSELAELAGPLIELATALGQQEETSDEVSPFIYAMF